MNRTEAFEFVFDALKDVIGTEARIAAAMRIAPLLVEWTLPGITRARSDELIEKVAALEIDANS